MVEPHAGRRQRFARAHGIAPERQFATWQDPCARGRIADVMINCTLDRLSVKSTLPALEQGYGVLLEKPMAHGLEDSVRLVQAAAKHDRLHMICHVLRYAAFFAQVHDVIALGRLRRIITIEHRQNVAYLHMAHSLVRRNWRSSHLESPMVLLKCCHDMDLLFWNLGPVRRFSSFGSPIHYRPQRSPVPSARPL